MLNPFKDVDWNPDRAKRRSFAISLIIGFPIVALVVLVAGYVRGNGWNVPLSLAIGGIGASAGLLFLAAPAIVRPFYVVWYFVACCMGLVVGNVMMAIVYYVFLTGLSLPLRLARRPVIRKTADKLAPTYWRDAGKAPRPEQYYRQF